MTRDNREAAELGEFGEGQNDNEPQPDEAAEDEAAEQDEAAEYQPELPEDEAG